jgi:hypothetical protein
MGSGDLSKLAGASKDSPEVLPLWFGGGDQFGLLHLPRSGQARGGVVLCPTLGSERLWLHSANAELAVALAAEGFVVLRFDYRGTGHSGGDLQSEWPKGVLQEGVSAAMSFVRATGVPSVALVGCRLGATIAASAVTATSCPDAMILWDPAVTGREFVRVESGLHRLALGGQESRDAGMTDLPGFSFGSQGRADILALGIPQSAIASVGRVLVATDPSRHQSFETMPQFGACEWLEAVSADDIIYGSASVTSTVGRLTTWLSTLSPPTAVTLTVPPHRTQIVVGLDDRGDPVTERCTSLGPTRLFAIESRAERALGEAPIVFVNTSNEPCLGPARMWVDLGRQLASIGRRTFRCDLSGLGDSPSRPGHPRDVVYASVAVDDVVDIARAVFPEDPAGVSLVGSCSGAHNVLEAGFRLGTRSVSAINPVLDAKLPDDDAEGGSRRIARPRRSWLHALEHLRCVEWLRQNMPEIGWRIMDVLGLQPSPAGGLTHLIAGGTQALLLCGPQDARRFERRSGWVVRGLTRTGRLTFVSIAGLDHALLLRDPREVVRDILLDVLSSDRTPRDELLPSWPSGTFPPEVEGAADRPLLVEPEGALVLNPMTSLSPDEVGLLRTMSAAGPEHADEP